MQVIAIRKRGICIDICRYGVRAMSICEGGRMGRARCRYVLCRYVDIGRRKKGGYVSSICRSVSICVEGGCEMPHVSICRYGEEEEEGGMCRYVSSKGEAKCRMCRYDTNLNRNLYISHSYETSAFTSAFTFI